MTEQLRNLFDNACEVEETHVGEEMDAFEREAAELVAADPGPEREPDEPWDTLRSQVEKLAPEPEAEPWRELAGQIRQHLQNQRDQAALCIEIHEGIAAALKPYEGKRVTRRLLQPIEAAFPKPEWSVFYSDYYDHYELHVRPSNREAGRFNGRYWEGEVCVRLAAKKDPYFRPEGDRAEGYRKSNAVRDEQLAGDFPERLGNAAHILFEGHLSLQELVDETPDSYTLRKFADRYAGLEMSTLFNRRPGQVRPEDLR